MDKEKKQQIVLIILIPIFLLGLIYARMQTASRKKVKDIHLAEEAERDDRISRIPSPEYSPDVEYNTIEKDPLENLFQAHLYTMRTIKSEEKIKTPLPKLAIEGIIWNSDMPQAIINGKVVRAGDTIKGVKIMNIEKQGVTIQYNEEKVLIERR